jgi:hypothetical protein
MAFGADGPDFVGLYPNIAGNSELSGTSQGRRKNLTLAVVADGLSVQKQTMN